MSAYPKIILRLGKQIASLCKDSRAKVFAVPDLKHERSRQFLEHLGFRPINDELYVFVGEK